MFCSKCGNELKDEATIGMINAKTTAVHVIPVIGKKEGGQIIAPMQSLKN